MRSAVAVDFSEVVSDSDVPVIAEAASDDVVTGRSFDHSSSRADPSSSDNPAQACAFSEPCPVMPDVSQAIELRHS